MAEQFFGSILTYFFSQLPASQYKYFRQHPRTFSRASDRNTTISLPSEWKDSFAKKLCGPLLPSILLDLLGNTIWLRFAPKTLPKIQAIELESFTDWARLMAEIDGAELDGKDKERLRIALMFSKSMVYAVGDYLAVLQGKKIQFFLRQDKPFAVVNREVWRLILETFADAPEGRQKLLAVFLSGWWWNKLKNLNDEKVNSIKEQIKDLQLPSDFEPTDEYLSAHPELVALDLSQESLGSQETLLDYCDAEEGPEGQEVAETEKPEPDSVQAPTGPEELEKPIDLDGLTDKERKAAEKIEPLDSLFTKNHKTNPNQRAALKKNRVVTGVVVKMGDHLNFYPQYEWDDGVPVEIVGLSKRYGNFGNIYLGSWNAWPKGERRQVQSGSLLNLRYLSAELRTDANTTSLLSLNGLQLLKEGRLTLAAEDASDGGYYRCAYLAEVANKKALNFESNAVIVKLGARAPSDLEAQPVLVTTEKSRRYYGPYPLHLDKSRQWIIKAQEAVQTSGGLQTCYQPFDKGKTISQTRELPEYSGLNGLPVVFFGPHFCQSFEEDRISDKDLIDIVCEGSRLDTRVLLSALRQVQDTELDDKLTGARLARIKKVLSQVDKTSETMRLVSAMTVALLESGSGATKELTEQVAQAIQAHPALIERFEAIAPLKGAIQNYQSQVQALQERIEELGSQERRLKQIQEKDKLTAEIKRLKVDLGWARDGAELKPELERMKSEKKALSRQIAELENQLNAQEQRQKKANEELECFNVRLDKTVEQVAHLAFDGEITAKILDAAETLRRGRQQLASEERRAALEKVPRFCATGTALHQELLRRLGALRDYGHNEYTNLLICLAQSFLTVLSGQPGSGKTSLSKHLAYAFGISKLDELPLVQKVWGKQQAKYARRFVPVSVERGWSSKRDLIGYYNPLTRRFESADPHRYEIFKQLDEEARSGAATLPAFVLLDEANLSPMEYYFADFMNICDSRDSLSYITLDAENTFQIPDTLRFIATINNDHTTEILSPRLLDRAWVITLPEFDLSVGARCADRLEDPQEVLPAIGWQAFLKFFGGSLASAAPKAVAESVSELKAQFELLGCDVSVRSQLAIARYASVASALMVAEDGMAPATVAIDFAVRQKLLPMISGSGKAYREQLEEILKFLKAMKLKRSEKLLEKIISRGQTAMDFYRFF